MLFSAFVIVGFMAGVATHAFGGLAYKYIDSPLLEVLNSMVPVAVMVVCSWLMARIPIGNLKRTRALDLAFPLVLGLMIPPMYLVFFGNEWQVLGGIVTGIVELPSVVLGPIAMSRILGRSSTA